MSAILNFVRGLVSAEKFRYKQDGYDLDLTYITPRIIAMGFPAQAVEGMYRNFVDDVASMMRKKHGGKFMIWNLSERPYDYNKFDNQVLEFGFPDHTAPPLDMLFKITSSMASWLNADPENVAVVHCMAGLGRTGTVICSYLLYSGFCSSASAALRYFGQKRCRDSRGVRIPSQIRYVHYYEAVMKGRPPDPQAVLLKKIVVQPVPDKIDRNGFSPILQVWATSSNRLLWSSSEQPGGLKTYTSEDVIIFDCDLLIQGDVTIRCFHLANARNSMPISIMSQSQVFRIMFHTAFVGSLLRCGKSDMDWAFKNKLISDRITVDVMFSRDIEGAAPACSDDQASWSVLTQRIVAEAPVDRETVNEEELEDEDGVMVSSPGGSRSALSTPTSSGLYIEAHRPAVLSKDTTLATSSDQVSRYSGPRQLLFVMINTIPRFNSNRGCQPCVQVWKGAEMVLCIKEDRVYEAEDNCIRMDFGGLEIQGPMVFKFFDLSSSRRPDAGSWNVMFSIAFETSQLNEDIMRMTRSHIQCTQADRQKFDDEFFVDLIFNPPQ